MGGHDYTQAERFGNLVPITTGTVNPFNVDRQMVIAAAKLALADPEDYLLISGPQILNAVVVALWLEKFKVAKLLQWSSRKANYVQIRLSSESVTRLAHQEGLV
jgi:hypothetical protein